jgi:nucleotide-binding universal stress UspA family protein
VVTALSSVLVSVAGNDSDEEAVRMACEMLNGNKGHKGRLHILYIIEVERALPVDAEVPLATAKGDAVLRRMEEVAKPFKLDPQAELLQSREAGYAVVQEAVDKDVEAIVMAVPYQTRHGEFSLGTTIPYVFEHAPCQVILWRDGRVAN